MITIGTLLWEPNDQSFDFSRAYDEFWVEKLYRGFARNLTQPFRFICWTDRDRVFSERIEQRRIKATRPDYGSCIQPYELNEPMILVGLDTVVVGNVDHLADYCQQEHRLMVPRDPIYTDTVCNGVALIPAGYRHVWTDHRGENDMEWIRMHNPGVIDDRWPGQVVSYRCHVKADGLDGVRIVYFHGNEKPHELAHVDWIGEHWR